jgi:flagellar protein FliS
MTTVSAIANAPRGELLCITYEMFLYNIEDALKTEAEERAECINRALDVIKALAEGLNFEVPIAHELFRLYVYVQGVLLTYKVTNQKLEHAYQVIDTIYKGFLEITESEGTSAPSMKNIEAVYAGMTYSKSNLNEMVMSDNNRGYKA